MSTEKGQVQTVTLTLESESAQKLKAACQVLASGMSARVPEAMRERFEEIGEALDQAQSPQQQPSVSPEEAGKRLHAAFALELNTRLADDERAAGGVTAWDDLPRQDQEAWIETASTCGERRERLTTCPRCGSQFPAVVAGPCAEDGVASDNWHVEGLEALGRSCEECEDGIYRDGAEWAPCPNCFPPSPTQLSVSRGDDFYLCFNCGEVTHQDDWTLWQPDGDHEFGAADYRPHGLREHDSDALLKCPRCGEMHGDNYVGAGVEEGSRALCQAERVRLLEEERFSPEEWAKALADSALAKGEGQGEAGVDLIAAERARQVEAEAWTPEHDDKHTHGEMAVAAACYAEVAGRPWSSPTGVPGGATPMNWPWRPEHFKPTGDAVRDLTKAGALIAAEIDRLHRPTSTSPAVPSDLSGLAAELEATNEEGFDEVLKLRKELEAMTDARDLCKRQTAAAHERTEKVQECWRHEKERADALASELLERLIAECDPDAAAAQR